LSFATRSPRLPHFEVRLAIISRCWSSIRAPQVPPLVE
jgi:hypothetical protein